MPKCVTSLTANAVVEARPHCTNPVGWHFGSDCLRKDNRVGHDHTAIAAAGVLPIRGHGKDSQHAGSHTFDISS